MSTATPPRLMTTEELLALPEDEMDHELIRGWFHTKPTGPRDRRHGRTSARVGTLLDNWLDEHPESGGEVVANAGFRLRRNPDSTVGLEVAYVSAEVASATPESAALFEGPPVLAVEILSPSDKQEDIDDKVALYLETGVLLVWVVNPRFRTVCVYRPDAAPRLYAESDELSGEPHLPGFRVAVAKLFRV